MKYKNTFSWASLNTRRVRNPNRKATFTNQEPKKVITWYVTLKFKKCNNRAHSSRPKIFTLPLITEFLIICTLEGVFKIKLHVDERPMYGMRGLALFSH